MSQRMQRVGPLEGLPDLVRRHGVALEAVIENAGIDAAVLADVDAMIPFATACRLLDRAAKLTGVGHIGLELGLRYDHMILGMVGALMANAPTMGDSFRDFVRIQYRNSRGAVVFLVRQDDHVHLGYGIYDRYEPGADQVYDVAMGISVNCVRRLGGRDAGPVEVLISHRGTAPREVYEALFGCRVRFNQPYSAVSVAAEAMRLPVEGSDPVLREELQAAMQAVPPLREHEVGARVRHLLKPALLRGEGSSLEIADQLGLHIRTLNRRLRDEGTTFRAIQQEVSLATASELLSLTDLPTAEIAATLGYGSQSSFERAFRRWTHLSPTRWRRGS